MKLLFFLTLFSLIPLVSGLAVESLWTTWQGVGAIALVICIFLMTSIFMVARGFNLREIEVWSKGELYQVLVSALLFGAFLGFTYFLEGFSQYYGAQILDTAGYGIPTPPSNLGDPWVINTGAEKRDVFRYDEGTGRWKVYRYDGGYGGVGAWVYTWYEWEGLWKAYEKKTDAICIGQATCEIQCPYPCHFYLARAFIGRVYEQIWTQARYVVKLYTTLAYIDTLRFGGAFQIFSVFWMEFSLTPFAGLSIGYEGLKTAFDFLIKAMLFIKFQEVTLLYLQNGVYPIFFVYGLILRTFWFTRKLGGLLIAIAIGVYTVLPLIYILGWYTLDTTPYLIEFETTLSGVGPSPEEGGITSWLPWNIGSLTFEPDEVLFTEGDEVGVLDATARFFLCVVAIPLIAVFTLIAFIKTLSPTLGGDIEIAGLTRIL